MSELGAVNVTMRVDAIRALLRHHPALLNRMLNGSGLFDPAATPEALDLHEPEETLARIAWDIWNGAGGTEFGMALEILPPEDFEAFIEAMRAVALLRGKIRHFYASGAEND
ncbi:MAG: hypothetical protein HY804_02725 [Nitrospinae bacterium]|nr:hypothetical protein [Nitrospinota bacterium]